MFPRYFFSQDIDEPEAEQLQKKVKVRKCFSEQIKAKLANVACGMGWQKFKISDVLFDILVNISFGQMLQASPAIDEKYAPGLL